MTAPPIVRPATLADAPGIGEVHVASWRAAYVGIVPQAHLDGLSAEKRAEMWRGFFEGPPRPRTAVRVAEADGRVCGFVNTGPSRDADGAELGEVRAIYVLRERWRTGLGRALLDAAVGDLRASGFAAATLWVLDANARGRAFYERSGWRADGTRKTIPIGGAELVEVRYRIDLAAARAGSRDAPEPKPAAG